MIETEQQLVNEEQCVIFEIGTRKAAIKLDDIVTINLLQEIIPIPRSPNHVIGVTNIENSIIPIINLELLLEYKEHKTVPHPIGLIVKTGTNSFCIYVVNLPYIKYLQVATEKLNSDFDIPSQWIHNIYQEDSQSFIPVLDPMKFWVSLGSNELIGPSAEFQTDELVQRLQKTIDDKTSETSIDNEEVSSELTSKMVDQVEIVVTETEPKTDASGTADKEDKPSKKGKVKKDKKKKTGEKEKDEDMPLDDEKRDDGNSDTDIAEIDQQ